MEADSAARSDCLIGSSYLFRLDAGFFEDKIGCLMFYNSSERTRFCRTCVAPNVCIVGSTGFPIGPRGDWHKKNRGPRNMQRNPLKLQAAAVGERTSVRRERRVRSVWSTGRLGKLCCGRSCFPLSSSNMYVCVSSRKIEGSQM